MTKLYRIVPIFGASLFLCTVASAQQASTTPQLQSSQSSTTTVDETRPATTTFFGDTGLWYVPTAEVLAHGKWSASAYRRGTNYNQGYSNVADIAGNFAAGIGNRAEVFGSFIFDTRIDRDVRPIFVNNTDYGGFIDRNPRVNTGWTGNNIGDLYIGGKYAFMFEPVSVAARVTLKIPTGDSDVGVSTGKTDFAVDGIVSKEVASTAELSGYAGYEHRGKPDGFDAPGGAVRWGVGASFPSRSPVRGFAELNGYIPSSDTATITTANLVGTDGSLPPAFSATENITRTTIGGIGQLKNGFFFGLGVSWNVPRVERNLSQSQDDPTADYWDWQIRIGYHPGVRRSHALSSVAQAAPVVAAAPQEAAAPPPPPPPSNRPPTVRAACDPCTVDLGGTSNLTATGQDPDGDRLTYRWNTAQGNLQTPNAPNTVWTAPRQEGRIPVTVTVDDGKGGTATDTVNLVVARPPAKTYTFEDVHFDFDRYTLRPEAIRALDEAVKALQDDRNLRLQIEGHTCDIGTPEYNLALGDRRARAVRDYFVSRGIATDRMETITYGEEMPKYDNSREETRRLNRRAALVVNVQNR